MGIDTTIQAILEHRDGGNHAGMLRQDPAAILVSGRWCSTTTRYDSSCSDCAVKNGLCANW